MATDRAAREEKVIEQVREWLPDLFVPGAVIKITRLDPEQNDGAMFRVERTPSRAFVCRRGGGS